MPVVQQAPRFSPDEAVRIAGEYYGLGATAANLPSERDQNFLLNDTAGARFVLKIANSEEALEILDLQNKVLRLLATADTGLEWPHVLPTLSGNLIVPVAAESGSAFFVRLLTWVDGVCFANVQPHGPAVLSSLGRALARTDNALAGFSHPAAHRKLYWDLRHASLARPHLELLTDAERGMVEPLLDAGERLDWQALPSSVIHGDANDYNILVDETGSRVTTVLDLGDMVHTATVCNLAIALAYAMLDEQDPIAAAAQVVAAYHDVRRLSEPEIEALPTLAATRLAMSVCYCAWQARKAPDNDYLNISNRPAWELIERLATMPADWPREVFRRACGLGRAPAPSELLGTREKHLGPSLSISYRQPLHIIRGWKQYLYDSGGRAYLDCVNNVAHVGHCHPRVVRAAGEQMALLNTNTRYLHEHLAAYVERLTATLPETLSVVYLVSSGSEANELALRLARAHTGRDGVIVVETAYHGNTNALIDISPYKFDGPGGRGKPAHVQVAPMPDVYRGLHRGADSGRRYAEYVAEAARRPSSADCGQNARNRPQAGEAGGTACPTEAGGQGLESGGLAAFFCESALSCGGQVILPAGYLREAYAAVRAAGGVCVADEVQTGFGRAGSHFWMFETQGVTPDIVTMGKPIGNGHPLGAVVTTPEIAASFANGMEYFNTFGGNPVSCAVGLAVLDAIREEGLQENARDAGEYLLNGLRQLAGRHRAIGDVRGQGLFLGFELVRDRETREPAADEASEIVNGMKERGVLLSTDGPLHNVIKIKPPMVFSRADADLVVERLDGVMSGVRGSRPAGAG
ncbi:MAG TPA: aminotransferase class III-fold pyridoxal phosphate-dependent enzyme [Bryobacteraceae bacterium]|jgi:4-aminobutyrate aminotransferase-like enzyme/Ser/Thr protein kinase RdoA (MazF antagonist)|nr:aminotransferase class III-fold pyridoxal phosphate-dependent enzyme [Bryobacteraceae bacterium]